MSKIRQINERPLPLICIPESQCNYLPDRRSETLFVDPQVAMNTKTYSALIEQGFRRSGELVYTPRCPHCVQCTSIKIDPRKFSPSRSQKRCLKKNSDLSVLPVKAQFSLEYFNLYKRYINGRHADGGMANPTRESFEEFLYSEWSNTLFLEMRKEQLLIGVAVIDVLPQGISAVYTFYEPNEHKRGLGNFAILWQLQLALKRQFEWVYLGYWIADSQKMNYKSQFQPSLGYRNKRWQPLENI